MTGALEGDHGALEELARLGAAGDYRARTPLLAHLASGESALRRAACEALGRLGHPGAVEPLVARLDDRDHQVRQAASGALLALGAASVEPLISVLGGAQDEVRRLACELLGKLRDGRSFQPLLGQLAARQAASRMTACEALGELGDARAIEPLIERLGDSRDDVRRAAGRSLGRLGESRLAEALIGSREGDEAALAQLARLAGEGDLRAVAPLAALWKDSRSSERCQARDALRAVAEAAAVRLGDLLCRFCAARFRGTTRRSSFGDEASWIACRACGKAGGALAGARQVVAVLDESWKEDLICAGGVARVNWLKRRALFDFDRVEIVAASDYEVERFTIAVGNDMDEYRRPRYKKMPCQVALECVLAEHTLRILRSMFGEVQHGW